MSYTHQKLLFNVISVLFVDMKLQVFSSQRDESDLVIIVEGHHFNVHKLIMKMASPVFKAMLEGNFKEKNEKEIELPGKKAEDFVHFLLQIYPKYTDNWNQLDGESATVAHCVC